MATIRRWMEKMQSTKAILNIKFANAIRTIDNILWLSLLQIFYGEEKKLCTIVDKQKQNHEKPMQPVTVNDIFWRKLCFGWITKANFYIPHAKD